MAAASQPRIVLDDMSAVLYPMNGLPGTQYEWTIQVADPAEWVFLAGAAAPGQEIPVVYDGHQYTGVIFGLGWDRMIISVVI